MPPKKKEEEKPTPLMGRFGTSLKCGIVGLPNVGKVPAFLHVTDIAGLVEGAHEGQGLGNAFLSHIWACDAIFHMIRAFEGEDVTHIEGEVNPVKDMEVISEELRQKDSEYLKDKVTTMEKRGASDKNKIGEYVEVLNKHLLLTSKPVMYLVNLSEKDYIRKKNKWLLKIKEWVDANDKGAVIIPLSGALETKLLDLGPEEGEKYLKEVGTQSALSKIITTGFKTLQLEYFFTAGKDEVKAWTILKGTKAPQAAGKIHTDFEKGFIMADVMKFDDFKELGSESAVKAAGKYKQEGKNYVVHDGDIIFFKFNAGAGLTDKKKAK
ncbi:Obg-like ATPase [Desmophyllum pertusum]|uniref:Obg-like ATPase n=1 Tax=Desmophyllum pertusum TaxID=174260 RepID=A0A9X0CK44_9CNID|nr:Obg-like ATPase [Desmophyllum pertusum]